VIENIGKSVGKLLFLPLANLAKSSSLAYRPTGQKPLLYRFIGGDLTRLNSAFCFCPRPCWLSQTLCKDSLYCNHCCQLSAVSADYCCLCCCFSNEAAAWAEQIPNIGDSSVHISCWGEDREGKEGCVCFRIWQAQQQQHPKVRNRKRCDHFWWET